MTHERAEYWGVDATGRLIATLFLTPTEVPHYNTLVTLAPPEESYEFRAFFLEGAWQLLKVTQDTTVEGTTLVNLPQPCTVTIAGQTVEVTDGTLELTFAAPGAYPYKVDAWPYLTVEGVINAT